MALSRPRTPGLGNRPLGKVISGINEGQKALFPLEIRIFYPDLAQGADLAFAASAGSDLFYCKREKPLRLICASEWIFTSIAEHIGIAVPDFAILQDPTTSEFFFGSKSVASSAGPFEVRQYLLTPQTDEIGRRSDWLGRHLSGLYVFDVFANNPDRQMANFLLVKDGGFFRLLAFDFASADLRSLSSPNFQIASTQTLSVGRLLRMRHGFFRESALEMIDRIASIPVPVIEGILTPLPSEWMSDAQKRDFCDRWSDGSVNERLSALRRGISDESLL